MLAAGSGREEIELVYLSVVGVRVQLPRHVAGHFVVRDALQRLRLVPGDCQTDVNGENVHDMLG